MEFPIWSILPFILLLLSIAVIPLITPHWWARNTNKLFLSFVASIPVLTIVVPSAPDLLLDSIKDYISFIVLLGALFVISGGIYIKGEMAGTPLVNTWVLAIGAVLANLIGTTGASMVLIRPYLRANHVRQHRAHLVVFFIFVVSNVGGALTPLGDPPLFLGFLRGVPFHWTLTLFPVWLFAVGALLIVFFFYDRYVFNKEDVAVPGELEEQVQPRRRFHMEGGFNFLFLAGVMAALVLSGYRGWPRGIQEAIMVAMAVLSWYSTPKSIHHANHFHFAAIAEVAALFLGIFVTMIPALEIMRANAGALNLRTPWHYFWLSGGLSSFLDNAPTYLTFTAMAAGITGSSAKNLSGLLQTELGTLLLRAVSCGSVFMGANSYIGNGPNFMVKSIAEHHNVKMPSFAGYFVYSGAILVPLFILLTFIFFV